MTFEPGNVPCNGCTACCRGRDVVRIFKDEDASQWKTEPHIFMKGHLMLSHQPNGDCFYLGEKGCTIQETKPQMCKEMDCRLIAKQINYTQARKHSGLNMVVWRKGKKLLRMVK